MKKEIKTQYGIQITKPWSSEMYAHNEQVAEQVRSIVSDMWGTAVAFVFSAAGIKASDVNWQCLEWRCATAEMVDIQRAVTCYGFGSGYDVRHVSERVEQELENAPLYRLKEIAEDLGLELEKEFIGFN
jgi:sugar phosphate isomerase/epimerase